jgi:hypothetical protein
METRGSGLVRLFGSTRDLRPERGAGVPVIAFGIACCVVAMLVVFVVAALSA